MDVNPKYLELKNELYEARKQYAEAQAQARIYAKQIEVLKSDIKSLVWGNQLSDCWVQLDSSGFYSFCAGQWVYNGYR